MSHQLEVVTYRIAQRIATGRMEVAPGVAFSLSLTEIISGHPANWYQVHVDLIEEDVVPGWVNARVRYDVNGTSVGPGYRPVTWYAGEATDWHTGLMRGVLPENQGGRGDVWADVEWTLAFRRSR